MKVIDHEPHTWFLLKEADQYYIDARVSRSTVEWSVVVAFTQQKYREYHAVGKVFLQYLAARIHNFTDEYQERDLAKEMKGTVLRAVQEWRAQRA